LGSTWEAEQPCNPPLTRAVYNSLTGRVAQLLE